MNANVMLEVLRVDRPRLREMTENSNQGSRVLVARMPLRGRRSTESKEVSFGKEQWASLCEDIVYLLAGQDATGATRGPRLWQRRIRYARP